MKIINHSKKQKQTQIKITTEFITQIQQSTQSFNKTLTIYLLQSQFNMIEERYLSYGQEKKYKFILVGDSNVGKTALFWRFTQGDFLAEKETQVTTIDFKIKNINLHNKLAKLYIWDTAGQEKYRSIVSTYFKGCHGVILVFDHSRQSSFKNAVEQWYDLCRLKAENAIIILVGNKSDLQKKVNQADVQKWANQHQLKYISTSVKTGENVENVFMVLAKMVSEKEDGGNKTQSFNLKSKGQKKKKCC